MSEVTQGAVEAVVPDVPAAVPDASQPEAVQDKAAPQTEGTDAPAGDESQVPKTFTQEELDKIVQKEKAKLARQRDQERGRREQLERELAKASIPQDEGKPKFEQFGDPESYAEAVAEWKLGQREREEKAVQQHKVASTFEAKAADLRADLEEAVSQFDEKRWDSLPISIPMAQAIAGSELGVKVAQHLYSHPEEAQRIADLPPARQAAEIGKLEVKLSSVPKVSNAPAPIDPISKGNARTAKRAEDMSMDEYIAHRKKEGARWAR